MLGRGLVRSRLSRISGHLRNERIAEACFDLRDSGAAGRRTSSPKEDKVNSAQERETGTEGHHDADCHKTQHKQAMDDLGEDHARALTALYEDATEQQQARGGDAWSIIMPKLWPACWAVFVRKPRGNKPRSDRSESREASENCLSDGQGFHSDMRPRAIAGDHPMGPPLVDCWLGIGRTKLRARSGCWLSDRRRRA